MLVSVPFRGSVFLNKKQKIFRFQDLVSVPFRGSVFLNYVKMTIIRNINNLLFPSPSGVLCFSICDTKQVSRIKNGFPSPSGVLCFSIGRKHAVTGRNSWFPSPSGVLCFSILFRCALKINDEGFRPLPGFCVSQYEKCSILRQTQKQCFRPLPGFCVSQY